MKRALTALGMLAVVLLTSASSCQGQLGKEKDSFTDEHGRVCTVVKWGDSASLDCDFPESR